MRQRRQQRIASGTPVGDVVVPWIAGFGQRNLVFRDAPGACGGVAVRPRIVAELDHQRSALAGALAARRRRAQHGQQQRGQQPGVVPHRAATGAKDTSRGRSYYRPTILVDLYYDTVSG